MSVERHASLAAVAGEWDDLAERVGAPTWLRRAWFDAWWRAFGAGTVEVLALRRGGRLAALVPLSRAHGVLRSPANWHTPGFGLLAEDGAARRELAAALFAGARRVELAFLDAEGGLAECRDAARAAGYRAVERLALRSPYVGTRGSWERYLQSLDRHHVKELGRRRRRLAELGELALEIRDGADGLDALLDEGFPLEGSGWKAERGTAIQSDPALETFYREVARDAAARGVLRLAFLRLDGRAIAFEYGFEEGGRWAILKGGYDQEYRRFGPGMLITEDEIRLAFERGLESCELLGADDPYKLAWTETVRERVVFQAFAPSPLGLADLVVQAHGRPLARRAVTAARGGADALRRRAGARSA